jgi:hypothetical protein
MFVVVTEKGVPVGPPVTTEAEALGAAVALAVALSAVGGRHTSFRVTRYGGPRIAILYTVTSPGDGFAAVRVEGRPVEATFVDGTPKVTTEIPTVAEAIAARARIAEHRSNPEPTAPEEPHPGAPKCPVCGAVETDWIEDASLFDVKVEEGGRWHYECSCGARVAVEAECDFDLTFRTAFMPPEPQPDKEAP